VNKPDAQLAQIPSVDRVLNLPDVQVHGRGLVVSAVRAVLADVRNGNAGIVLPDAVRERAEAWARPRLRRVFNLTGIVLHTNLGRALLPRVAVEAAITAMTSPCALEYDVDAGAAIETTSSMNYCESSPGRKRRP
jgi:L-seryl-tRNA(Ser) seleniumtransferase